MSQSMMIASHDWVYVLVQNPGGDEQIVGQTDEGLDIAFVPAFMDKDDAQYGVIHMAKQKGYKYEIQAIIYEDLVRYAGSNNLMVFILDAQGKILSKHVPGND